MNPLTATLTRATLVFCMLLMQLTGAHSTSQQSIAADTTAVDAVRADANFPNGNQGGLNGDLPASGFSYTADGFPIFGSQLFQGDFKDLSFRGFNPNYQIGIGDEIQVMIWGAMDDALKLTVDAQGNIFLPRVGPVPVLGVRNADLIELVNKRIRRVYRENVDAYANLLSTQAVKVFVSGFVRKPGLYEGFASDSVLYYLDRAGGIDPERGSYLRISLLRHNERIAEVNLYDFLENGTLPITQFRDGDVVLVGPIGNTVIINGEVSNPGRFEFLGPKVNAGKLMTLASPSANATNLSIRRNQRGASQALVYSLEELDHIDLEPRDRIQVSSRHAPETILVSITGEHRGVEDIVLPHGALLADAISLIEPTNRSNLQALQLFRESVAERQKQLLIQALDNLERSVLNARSSSLEEAQLRLAESEMILNFVERARAVEPKGQVLLESLASADRVHLEDGDIIFVPSRSSLVTVYGEVNFPNTQTHRNRESITNYVERAGGFSPNANKNEIIVIRANGTIDNVGSGRRETIEPGDEIIVLPRPDSKNLQLAKDISTILYQLAISARVVIGL